MNAVSWILLTAIAAAFVWCVVRQIKRGGGCGCGQCNGCGRSCACKANDAEDQTKRVR